MSDFSVQRAIEIDQLKRQNNELKLQNKIMFFSLVVMLILLFAFIF